MNYLKIAIGVLIALSASRFIPHPPNFTSLLALSFYVPALLGARFIPALIGFNLGVEIGQVLIILCLFTLVFLLKSLINFRVEILRIYTASGLACLGIYWFVERLF